LEVHKDKRETHRYYMNIYLCVSSVISWWQTIYTQNWWITGRSYQRACI